MIDNLLGSDNILASIVDIHNQPMGQAIDQFQKNNLLWIRKQLCFDCAFWAIHDQSHNMHYYAGVDLATDNMDEWNENANDDAFMQLFATHPGAVTTVNTKDIPNIKQSAIYQYYSSNYGVQHYVMSVFIDPDNGASHILCLIRYTEQPEFSEQQRKYIEILSPHLVIAWKQNNKFYMSQESNRKEQLVDNTAIADKSGILLRTCPEFIKQLKKEWPNWSDQKLPDEVCDWLNSDPSMRHDSLKNRKIQIHCKQHEGFYQLSARENNSLDTLTEREYSIAKLFAADTSYKEIAIKLKISPSTVRNHLNKIYLRLGIKSKLQLAQKMDSDN